MPYISAEDDRRYKLRIGEPALIAGELNYQIFYYVKHNYHNALFDVQYNTIKGFVDQFLGDKPNYQRYNDMTGALLRCSIEIARRLGGYSVISSSIMAILEVSKSYDDEIAKYEDTKIISNGDVE